ncbi:MAG: hypothetical protein FJ358_03245 [Thaumarchaeota archaeon]|nr:hypothetical protein [Nitrososphaerota archaeon]
MKNKQETSLNSAQQDNQNAARFLLEFIETSFGPKGFSKLRFNEHSDVFVLRDCKTMLEKADFKHPEAAMMRDLAKSIHTKWGDGSAGGVLLTCSLIDKGFELVGRGIHPSKIVDGYSIALNGSLSFLEKIETVNSKDGMHKLVSTFFSSKLEQSEADHLTDNLCKAVSKLLEAGEFDAEMVKVIAKAGSSIFESNILSGMAVEAEVLSGRMPTQVCNAQIAIVEELLDVKKTTFSSQVQIDSPKFLGALQKQEDRMVIDQVKPIIECGANVLFTHKGIEEPALSMLAGAKILGVRRIGMTDLKRIARASGATIVHSTRELSPSCLGSATTVQQKPLGDRDFIFIDGCKDPRAVSLILKSPSQRGANQLEELVMRALKIVENFTKNPVLVAGGGALEFALYQHLQSYALKLSGKEQIAIQVFAEALLSLVETLAKNCGMNPMDAIAKFASSSKNSLQYIDAGSKNVETFNGEVVELLEMKKGVIASAAEVANTILHVGNVYPAKRVRPKEEKEPDYP